MMRHIADWGERVPPILHACPDIIRNSKDLLDLLVEEQVVITKVRLLHLSMDPSSSNKGSLYSHPRKRGEYKNKKQLPVGLSCVNFVNFQAARFFISPSVSRNRGDISFFFCR